jgi:hypothetical protein
MDREEVSMIGNGGSIRSAPYANGDGEDLVRVRRTETLGGRCRRAALAAKDGNEVLGAGYLTGTDACHVSPPLLQKS